MYILCLVISSLVGCGIILFLYHNQYNPKPRLTADEYIAKNIKRRCKKVKRGWVRVTFYIDMPWGWRLSHSYHARPQSYTFKGFELDDALAKKYLIRSAKMRWQIRQYNLTK